MSGKTQAEEIDDLHGDSASSHLSLMELNDTVIGAVFFSGTGYFEEKINAMRAAGIDQEAIKQTIALHQHQRLELVKYLCRDTMQLLTSALESIRSVFDSVGSEHVMRGYEEISDRLNTASKTLQDHDSIEKLLLVLELLAEVDHELRARMRMMKTHGDKDAAILFTRKVKAAPLTREVKAAVNLSDDLAFLDESSWSKRVDALRQRERARFASLSVEKQKLDPCHGELQAGERHIVNILKDLPRVRKYLRTN